MSNNGNQLFLFEWIGGIVWVIFWGSLAYIAISERSITLGGKGGITHFDGLWAESMGFILLGTSLLGVNVLLRIHPFKRLLQLLLFMGWLCSAIVYFACFYP
ncbi:MAG: hypothetical protein HHJ12_18435 [Glaciimonas sp.]|nr:hypothetical protein [Glaciimonas sp.]